MPRSRLFVRQKDGRIQVRLGDVGRKFVRARFESLVDSHDDLEHQWNDALAQSIGPSQDVDDPLRRLERQKATATNAELALITSGEEYLSEGEAWAWLGSLQHVLRAAATDRGIIDYATLDEARPEDLDEIHSLQQLLFDLSDALE